MKDMIGESLDMGEGRLLEDGGWDGVKERSGDDVFHITSVVDVAILTNILSLYTTVTTIFLNTNNHEEITYAS